MAVTDTYFHPTLPYLLSALCATFIGFAAMTIWFRRTAKDQMVLAPFVVCWLAWSAVIASSSLDLYGPVASVSVAAGAVILGLIAVYGVALLGEGKSASTPMRSKALTAAKVLVAGLLGTAVVPVSLLMLVILLGIDGP